MNEIALFIYLGIAAFIYYLVTEITYTIIPAIKKLVFWIKKYRKKRANSKIWRRLQKRKKMLYNNGWRESFVDRTLHKDGHESITINDLEKASNSSFKAMF